MCSLSSRTNELIAIDPSVRALGWAYFYEGRLQSAGTVKAESLRDMTNLLFLVRRSIMGGSSCAADLIVEQPKIYPVRKWKGDPNDIIKTAMAAGLAIGEFSTCASLILVEPHTWKGNRPKDVDNIYTLRLLSVAERQKLGRKPDHNAVDAVGLGLWALKRR